MDFSIAELKKAISGKLLNKQRYEAQWVSLDHREFEVDEWVSGSKVPMYVDDWLKIFNDLNKRLEELNFTSKAPSDASIIHTCMMKCDGDYDYQSYWIEFNVGYYETERERLERVYEEEVALKLERQRKAEKKAADKKVDVELEIDALMIRANKDKKLKKILAEKLAQLGD